MIIPLLLIDLTINNTDFREQKPHQTTIYKGEYGCKEEVLLKNGSKNGNLYKDR